MIHRDEWAIGGLALLARLIPIGLTLDLGLGLDDMLQYDDLAQSLLAGHGYTWYGGIPTAFRAPLYPLFLATIYLLFGHHFVAVRGVQAGLGAILCLITYRLALHLYDDRRVARVAGLLVALYTLLLIYPVALVTENLFLPLTAAALLLTLEADRRGDRWRWVAAGFLWAAAILTRSVVAAFLPLVLLWVWWGRALPREKVLITALLIVPTLVTTLPWAIRNSLLLGQPVYVESSLGFQLYLGYHPRSEGTFDARVAADILGTVQAQERRNLAVEVDLNRTGVQKTLEFIAQDPGRLPLLTLSKASHFFRLDTRGLLYFYTNDFVGPLPAWLILLVGAALAGPTFLVLLGAPWGLMASLGRRETLLLNGFILYFIAIHAAILSEPRFNFPLIPVLAAYAAYGYSRLPAFWTSLRSSGELARPATFAAIVLSLLLIANWGYQFWVEAERWAIVLSPGGNSAHFSY